MSNKKATNKQNIIGLKELRENMNEFIDRIQDGEEFTVLKRSKPVFRLGPLTNTEERWEEAADFTKAKKGGVEIDEILNRL